MLRKNTESFAPEFSLILSDLGVNSAAPEGFQLLKFERVEPDVFVWLLRFVENYIVTLRDGGSKAPSPAWLAKWCGGLKEDELELLAPKDKNHSDGVEIMSGYDHVKVYRLPQNYDHCDHIKH